MAAETPETSDTKLIRRMAAWTRFVVLVPALGLFAGAVTLVAVATVDAVKLIAETLTGHIDHKRVLVGFIELADVYLLAIVLYIMAIGLYELFVDDQLPVPAWLRVKTLDDLKEKLVAVVVVVLGVFFLGRVIESKEYLAVLELGVGIAAVILALGYFTSRVILHKEG